MCFCIGSALGLSGYVVGQGVGCLVYVFGLCSWLCFRFLNLVLVYVFLFAFASGLCEMLQVLGMKLERVFLIRNSALSLNCIGLCIFCFLLSLLNC